MCDVSLADKVIEYLQDRSESGLAKRTELIGAARFKIADPTNEEKLYKIVSVEDITFQEAQRRAIYCIDALWVPNDLKRRGFGDCSGKCKFSSDCNIDCFCDPFSGCE